MNKETRQLLRKLDIPGNAVGQTRNGHLKINVYGTVIFTGSTPSDHRSIKNLSAQLKRAKKSPKNSATNSPAR